MHYSWKTWSKVAANSAWTVATCGGKTRAKKKEKKKKKKKRKKENATCIQSASKWQNFIQEKNKSIQYTASQHFRPPMLKA